MKMSCLLLLLSCAACNDADERRAATRATVAEAAVLPPAPAAAEARTESVTLSWAPPEGNTDGSVLSSLKGYVIHYGINSQALNDRIDIASARESSYTFTGLKPGVTYYFAVTAVNGMDMGGELSEVVSVTI